MQTISFEVSAGLTEAVHELLRSSAQWVVTAASLPKRKLDFALNLKRLKSFPSHLVRR